MIHFQHPDILYLLILVPLLIAMWIVQRRLGQRRLERFADSTMFRRLIPDASHWRPNMKYALILAGYAFLVVALANPQVGSKMVKGERQGCDVAICLDISNSMMAEDIQPNRLERSKRMVTNLMNQMAGDRVSLVVFAGSSHIQMPLTNDYSAAKLFLDQIDCSLIATQGTAIGDAIEKAMLSFGYGDSEREWERNNGRAIIVISDGENFEDDAEEAAKEAAKEGILVCTIGMGLPDGVPLPQYNANGQRTGYRHDNDGNTITTRLNEDMLIAIAHAGNGVYVRGGNINASTDDIIDKLDKLEKNHYDDAMFSEYETRFYIPLAAALLCLLAELLIFERRNRKINLGKLFLLVLLLVPADAYCQADKGALRKGNKEYKKEHYDEAGTRYRKSMEHDSTYYRGHYNLGNALYRQKHYDEAAEHYTKALQQPNIDPVQRSQIYHNQGNSHLKAGLDDKENGMQHFQQAIDSYKEALKLNPKNDDTRYNLSYAQKLLAQAQQGQQNKDQQGQQNKDQQDQQSQQNQQNQQDQQSQQNKDKQDEKGQQKQQNQKNDKPQDRKGDDPATKQKKQDAERMLNAMLDKEKKTMKERQQQVEPARIRRTDKDW